MYSFNSLCNRLLQANYEDYNRVLSRFIGFIKDNPVIYEYVVDCGVCDQKLEQEFKEVSGSYGRVIFDLGDTDEEEVRNVFAILCYIVDHNVDVYWSIAEGYTSSNKYQDRVKAFNDRVTMVLIRHIETHLSRIGIDMGVDEKVQYNITVHKGQVNIANDNAQLTATSTVGVEADQLDKLIRAIKDAARDLSPEDQELLNDNLDVIQAEAGSDKPRKGFLKIAINGLKAIKGSVEFGAAVSSLLQFAEMMQWIVL